MAVYRTQLKRRKNVAANTAAFFFEKPTGFDFIPGQFISIRLPRLQSSHPKESLYEFSIASAPHDEELMILTRIRGSIFKETLRSMPLQDPVELEGPFGHMALPESIQKHAVFLAGGIGISPFYSMIRHAYRLQLPHRMTLFHSNSSREFAVFHEELIELSQKHAPFSFVPVFTDPPEHGAGWGGETGYFTKEMIFRYVDDLVNSMYYIVGPAKLVLETKRILKNMGLAENSINIEIFSGY